MLIVPYLIYFSISKWTYPMKDYIGESGCFLLTFSRGMYQYEVQLSSFFMVFFRYICLFQGKYLQRIKLTPHVSFIYIFNLIFKVIWYFKFWPSFLLLWLEPQCKLFETGISFSCVLSFYGSLRLCYRGRVKMTCWHGHVLVTKNLDFIHKHLN